MQITQAELAQLGFRSVGTVYPCGGECRVEINRDVPGFAIYAMVVNGVVKKFGTTGRKNSTFRQRMSSTFSALRTIIRLGPPYTGDPFKLFAPAAILSGHDIELWAKESSRETFEREETDLNSRFRPEWTKEGQHPSRAHRAAQSQRL